MSEQHASPGEPPDGDDLFQFDERPAAGLAAASAAPEGAGEPSPSGGALPLRPMGLVDDTLDDAPAPQRVLRLPAALRGGPMPPIVVPLLLVMAVANLALVGLTWKSLSRVAPSSAAAEHAVEDPALAGHGAHGALGEREPSAARGQRQGERLPRALPHLAQTRDEAWAVLDDAERTLEAGEFVAARRALYSLLTVLDRVERDERPGIEARAGLLIAESYRLQAQGLDGEDAP